MAFESRKNSEVLTKRRDCNGALSCVEADLALYLPSAVNFKPPRRDALICALKIWVGLRKKLAKNTPQYSGFAPWSTDENSVVHGHASEDQRLTQVACRRQITLTERFGVAVAPTPMKPQMTSSARRGNPVRRNNQGLDAHRANHVSCAAKTGHMDARAEPMSVWGSDAWGGRPLKPKCGEACFAAGAVKGRSHNENTGGDGQAKSGSAGERSPDHGRSFVSSVDTGGAMVTPFVTPFDSSR